MKLLFFMSWLYILAAPVAIYLITEKIEGIWLFIMAGVFAIVFCSLDKFESVILGPLNAKVRKIESEIATVKRLAQALTKPTLATLHAVGRIGIPQEFKTQLEEELINNLKAIGLDDKEITKARLIADLYRLRDLRAKIYDGLILAARSSDEMKNFFNLGDIKDNKPSDEYTALIEKKSLLTDEINEAIGEYEVALHTWKKSLQ